LKTEKIQAGDPIKPSIYVEINKNSSNKNMYSEKKTLSELLEALHELTGKMLVLIIDEALCTQYTESGISSMYALKSALDHLTINSNGLRIVFANDNNPELSCLVRNVNEVFYCSNILDIP
jgi:hypothetical protein